MTDKPKPTGKPTKHRGARADLKRAAKRVPTRPKNELHVTMHVLARREIGEVKRDRSIKELAQTAFESLMKSSPGHQRVAKKLSLPDDTAVRFDVEVAGRRDGVKEYEGHIPVMVGVTGKPGLMEQLTPDAMEEIANTVFKEIRDVEPSTKFAEALGYDTSKGAKFHIYLPHQVRLRGPAQGGRPYGDGDGDGDGGDVVAWAQGGWSKGCNSWPW